MKERDRRVGERKAGSAEREEERGERVGERKGERKAGSAELAKERGGRKAGSAELARERGGREEERGERESRAACTEKQPPLCPGQFMTGLFSRGVNSL